MNNEGNKKLLFPLPEVYVCEVVFPWSNHAQFNRCWSDSFSMVKYTNTLNNIQVIDVYNHTL